MSYVEDHYSELVAKFADPRSRTRARLRPVYAAMLDALWKVEQYGAAFFDQQESILIDLLGDTWETVEQAWRTDMQGVQMRSVHIYQPEIVPPGVPVEDLDEWCSPERERCENPDEIIPRSWEGLVAGRRIDNPDNLGAGPVPDAAMPAYLAAQIDILQRHVDELDGTWFIRLLKSIPPFIEAAGETIIEVIEAGTEALREGSPLLRILPWALGAAVVGGVFARTKGKKS